MRHADVLSASVQDPSTGEATLLRLRPSPDGAEVARVADPDMAPPAEAGATDIRPLAPVASLPSIRPPTVVAALRPAILDVFTSPKGAPDRRQRIFFRGESMQWNVVHRVDQVVSIPYFVTLRLQRLGLGYYADPLVAVETVFPIEVALRAQHPYRFLVTRNAWSWDAVPEFDPSVAPGGAWTLMERFARGHNLIAAPGVWRATAVVRTVSRVNPELDLRATWDYELADGHRAPD